ncbi:MAG: SMP-30/gluconolactonase/LRE family protein [Myxococcota bacterium]
MRRPGQRLRRTIGIVVLLAILYLLLWPLEVDPVAWEAPANPGLTGPYAENHRLAGMELLSIGDHEGPEDVALDAEGRIYVPTLDGRIVRLEPDGSRPATFAETGGRPLGVEFDARGHLIVADAFRGLVSVSPEGEVAVLADEADGVPIAYADDVDVAPDGKIYFSDASTKFGAEDSGHTLEASKLEILEHAGTGRLLVYDPESEKATTALDGLTFANGVAVSPDGRFVLVNETGSYRVLRLWLEGPEAGSVETLVDALPGFPDNVSTGMDGRYWVALVSPRNDLLDGLSGAPFVRKMVQRLPAFMRPDAVSYGHVVAVNGEGEVVADLQDPEGRYPMITSVTETDRFLYLGSLVAPELARVSKSEVGLSP